MLRRAFLTNSSGILLSRIFGFLRDLMTASVLGASVYSDIFFVAFKIPNLFRRVFGEGAFNQAFLPSFIGARHKGAFTLSVGVIFLGVLTLLSLLVTLLRPILQSFWPLALAMSKWRWLLRWWRSIFGICG